MIFQIYVERSNDKFLYVTDNFLAHLWIKLHIQMSSFIFLNKF